MKWSMTFVGTLCLAVVWVLLLPEASALALPPQVAKTSSSLVVPVMLGVVVLCLVIGIVLRSFSKPPGELSINQRTK